VDTKGAGLQTYVDAYRSSSVASHGVLITLDLDWNDTSQGVRMDGSATLLREDAGWELFNVRRDNSYFGYVWHPDDNLAVADCCYYHDAHSNQRRSHGHPDRCAGNTKAPYRMCNHSAAAAGIAPNNSAGEDCIQQLVERLRDHGCPQARGCEFENEVVTIRHLGVPVAVREALGNLSDLGKPLPAALVLTYVPSVVVLWFATTTTGPSGTNQTNHS
jgi:hypothetical protein